MSKNNNEKITCETFREIYYNCLKSCNKNPIGAVTSYNKKCANYYLAYKKCNNLCKNDIVECKEFITSFSKQVRNLNF